MHTIYFMLLADVEPFLMEMLLINHYYYYYYEIAVELNSRAMLQNQIHCIGNFAYY